MMLYLVRASRIAVRINAGEPSMAAKLGSCNKRAALSREFYATTIISVLTKQETPSQLQRPAC
jgi:hypothetical protein